MIPLIQQSATLHTSFLQLQAKLESEMQRQMPQLRKEHKHSTPTLPTFNVFRRQRWKCCFLYIEAENQDCPLLAFLLRRAMQTLLQTNTEAIRRYELLTDPYLAEHVGTRWLERKSGSISNCIILLKTQRRMRKKLHFKITGRKLQDSLIEKRLIRIIRIRVH